MDSRVVDIQHVFIAVRKKLHVEVGIQTDLGNCKALPLLDFCALLVDGQAKDDSCAAESESSLTIWISCLRVHMLQVYEKVVQT